MDINACAGVAGTISCPSDSKIVTGGAVTAEVTTTVGSVEIDAGGDVTGGVTGHQAVTIVAGGQVKNVKAETLSVSITAGGEVTGPVSAGQQLWVKTAGAAFGTFTSFANYVYIDAGTTVTGQLQSLGVGPNAYVQVYAGGNVDARMDSSGGVLVTSGGQVANRLTSSAGVVYVNAAGDVSATIRSSVCAWVESGGSFTGDIFSWSANCWVYVSVAGDLNGPVRANGKVRVDATNILKPVTSDSSTVTINACGDITATITAKTDAFITANGDLTGSVTAQQGAANVALPGGDLKGTVTGQKFVFLNVAGNATGATVTTLAGGLQATFGGNVDAKSVFTVTGGDANVTVGGTFWGTLNVASNPPFAATGAVTLAATQIGGVVPPGLGVVFATINATGNVTIITAGTGAQANITTSGQIIPIVNGTINYNTGTGLRSSPYAPQQWFDTFGQETLHPILAAAFSPFVSTGPSDRIVYNGHPVLPGPGQGPLQIVNGKWILQGKWKMSLVRQGSDIHSFIVFSNGNQVHTFGRYGRDYGSGNNKNYAGVFMDEPQDIARLNPTKSPMAISISVTDPVILGGTGYSWIPGTTGACDSYAVTVWNINVPYYLGHPATGIPPLSYTLDYINPFNYLFGNYPVPYQP